MAVTTTQTNKPFNPRGNDQSPKGYNRASLFSGKALDFDGVNDYVIGSTLDITDYTAISVSMHLNADEVTTTQVAFSLRHSGSDDIRIVFYNGDIEIGVDDGTYYRIVEPVVANKSYFVTLSFDGSTLKGYLNGQEVGSMDASFDFSTADGTYQIGKRVGSVLYYNGKVSGTKLFNTALTAAQVADLYNNPEKVVPTGVDNTALKLWLPMQEGAGTTAYDGSGNGNHGTISGATWTHGIGAPVSQTAVIDWNKGTNKLPDSSDLLNNTYWLLFGDTAVEGGYTAPDGTNTAFKVSGTDNNLVQQGISSTTDYRAIWARTTSGTGTAHLTSYHGNTNNLFTITEEWQKFSVDSSISTGAVNFYVVDFRGSGTLNEVIVWQPHLADSESVLVPTIGTTQTTPVLLPQGLTSGRDITGVNLFENVRKQGALNLDGNSWAEVHDNESLDITDAITLEAWVYWDNSTDKGLMGKWESSNNQKAYLLYQTSNEFRMYISSNGSLADFQGSTGSPSIGWNHLVGTYDGANIKLYLNGAFDSSKANASGLNATNLNLEIGRHETQTSSQLNAPIAQPRIYNRALTAEEVQRNYNAGKNTYTN